MRPRKRQKPTRCWTVDILWFLPFRRIAPAVPMNGFSLEPSLLLNALSTIVFRNLSRVVACARHSLISLVHLKAFRSFSDVEYTHFLFCKLSAFLIQFNTCWIYKCFLYFFGLKGSSANFSLV